MEQLQPYTMKDLKNNFQKQLLLKKRLKITKRFHQINQVDLVILAKGKLTVVLSLFMELKMFKDLILGMLLAVFMVNLVNVKLDLIMILENQFVKTVEMLSIQKKIKIDHLVCQQSEKISLTKNLNLQLIIRTTEMNQKQSICYSHLTFKSKEYQNMILRA